MGERLYFEGPCPDVNNIRLAGDDEISQDSRLAGFEVYGEVGGSLYDVYQQPDGEYVKADTFDGAQAKDY